MTDQMIINKTNDEEMCVSYWKSVAFAEDAYSMMKEIKEKLL